MKKIIYICLLFVFSINVVNAFEIDINKINIASKGNELINELDKTYKIDIEDFDKTIIYDEEIKKLTLELVNLTLSNKSFDDKFNEFSKKYLFTSSTNGFDTLTGSLFIKMFVEEIDKKDIQINYIKDVKTVKFNGEDAMSFVYLPNAKIDGEVKDLILAYWLKKDNDGYKLYFPWLSIKDDLKEYFANVASNEDNGINIGGTYNKISLTNEEVNEVSNEILQSIYDNNKYSNVQITGMNFLGSNVYGSGFVLRSGVIATTWSNFLKFLTESNYIFVNDVDGNTYEIDGIIAAQIDYDIVVLKLKDEVLQGVTLAKNNELKTDDKVFTINSKENGSFSINYGSFLSIDNGRLKNLFALTSGDIGSALYDINGNVVGFNVGDVTNSDLSYANSTKYIKELQDILKVQSFNDIKYSSIEDFKEKYYSNYGEEKEYDNVNDNELNLFKKVGDVLNKIELPLLKISSVDNIFSLRYKNTTGGMIDTIYLIAEYQSELESQGYKLAEQSNKRIVYVGNKYKVIIKNNLDYLIILIMEN